VPETPESLDERARAAALAAVRGEEEVERRAVPLRETRVEWSRPHLRLIHDARFGVYERSDEVEVVLDPDGRLLELDEPRNAPATDEVHRSEEDAIEVVARMAGVSRDSLTASYVRSRLGGKAIRVASRPPRVDRKGRPRPQDEVEGYVNANNGRLYRLKFEPAPPEPPEPPEPAEPAAAGEAPEGEGGAVAGPT